MPSAIATSAASAGLPEPVNSTTSLSLDGAMYSGMCCAVEDDAEAGEEGSAERERVLEACVCGRGLAIGFAVG